jgi:hypothetical protein
MHPKLADTYMMELAEEMALERGFYPTTDETMDHVAVSGVTMNRLASALLDDEQLATREPSEHEVESQLASVSVQAVVPRQIEHVPVEKIIAVRKKGGPALAKFQEFIRGKAQSLKDVRTVNDANALRAHLEAEFEKEVQPELDGLKQRLHELQVDWSLGAFNVRVAAPPLLASLAQVAGLAFTPLLAAGAGLALAVIPLVRDNQKQAREEMKASPAAWLLRIEEGLQPEVLSSWVSKSARKFVLGV